MRILILFIILTSIVKNSSAQETREQQKLRSILTESFESIDLKTRTWFVETANQQPATVFDSSAAKSKLHGKFTVAELTNTGELFAVMMAYLKMVNKEAREDRKIQNRMRELTLASKEEKIKLDNKAIDAQMQEAREKAEAAMNAAVTQLITSMMSAGIQISAASAAGSGNIPKTPTRLDSIRRKLINPSILTQKQKSELVADYLKKLEGQLNSLKKKGK